MKCVCATCSVCSTVNWDDEQKKLGPQPDHMDALSPEQLQRANIRIAVDDFGTGYSSLNYLRKFPISTLKIDRVFIEDIVDNEDTLQLAQTVIAIAKSLNLGVIAEGVETWEQYQILSENGCDEVQGYYMSRALSETALLDLVACVSE